MTVEAAAYTGPFTEHSVPDQTGRTFFVTGANTGIGYETARVLAQKGARVLLGCRSQASAEQAMARIAALHPRADLHFVALDLADLTSVRAAAEVAGASMLDGLINNAGVMVPPRTLTPDGIESQFGINHLGHFALTGLLIPNLRQSARIVTVSSSAHHFGRLDLEDLSAERSYRAGARYAMSKLANLLFTYELARRLSAAGSAIAALACHPGGATTDLSRHLPAALTATITPLASLVMNSAAMGALPTLRAATAPDAGAGDYFGPGGWFEIAGYPVSVASSPRARDPRDALQLWERSVDLTGVDPFAAEVL